VLCTSGFVYDIMFGHKQRGKGDATKAYTQSDSQGGCCPLVSHGCLRLPCWKLLP